MSGAFLALINLLTSNELTGLFLCSILLGIFGIGCILTYENLRVSWKRYIPVFVVAPVIVEYGYGTEIIQVLLMLLGYMYFQQSKSVKAGILLGLASGVKYLPLLLLPVFLQYCKSWKYDKGKTRNILPNEFTVNLSNSRPALAVSWLGTFGFGMFIQYALSPVNFVRSISFYSGYGIEGSWIGLLFPGSIINYTKQTTWYIGQGTSIHPLDLYEAVSATLVLGFLVYILRLKNYTFEEKLIFVFTDIFVFLWISAPQFLINVVGLLPIVYAFKVNKLNMGIFYVLNLFCFTPFIFFYGGHTSLIVAFDFQIVAELFLVLFVYVAFVVPKHLSEFRIFKSKQAVQT